MGLTKLAVRIAVPLPKVEAFDRYLFIGPHPDDIEIGAGATVKKLTEQGKQVTFLICTDGRFGDGASNGVKGDALAALRKQEAIRSAALLGVRDVRFLELCDGAGYRPEELEQGIAETIAATQPDVLFAPDPASKSECHADHLLVGRAAQTLACFAPYAGVMQNRYGTAAAPVKAVAFYMTARPNRFVRTGKRLKTQLAAIFDCHQSQYGLRTLSTGGEAFRILGQTHLHCLPESGEIG